MKMSWFTAAECISSPCMLFHTNNSRLWPTAHAVQLPEYQLQITDIISSTNGKKLWLKIRRELILQGDLLGTWKLALNFPPPMSLPAGVYEGDVVIVSRNLKALEEALQESDDTAQDIR